MDEVEESGMQDTAETPGEVTPDEVGQTGEDTQIVGGDEIVGEGPGPDDDDKEE